MRTPPPPAHLRRTQFLPHALLSPCSALPGHLAPHTTGTSSGTPSLGSSWPRELPTM